MPESEYKWIKNQRQGRCQTCNELIQPGTRCLWSLLDKKHIYCEKCANHFGHIDPWAAEGEGKGTVGDSKSLPSMTTTTESSYEAIKTNYGNEEILYKRAYMDDFVILFVRRRDA